ncbi:MAG: diiron oxygenase [Aeromicrobium sp.]|uniref:AurF N-oxygenase family protein n=1 Tax=Aeromicrobium sp. TaxID=1871063 RepID=UPI0039E3CBA1
MSVTTSYDEKLAVLSEGSVHQHFDAFEDIAWDEPAFAIEASDPRLKAPTSHLLAQTEWYQSLPEERQIEVGTWFMAQMCKVGLHFENLLIRGLMGYVFTLDNDNPEFRYVTHEATEETHHTQMFQEFVNRTGADAPGLRWWAKPFHHVIPMFSTIFPEFFFVMVLGGEEPIDHMQKHILRASEDELHPLMRRITQIHVAEEARHISFAHSYLVKRSQEVGFVKRALLALLTPIVMRIMCDMILAPDARSAKKLGIPRKVRKQMYWRDPASKQFLSDMFGDVRMLADQMGIRTRWTRPIWKAMGIDGAPSRFRGETHERAALAHGER